MVLGGSGGYVSQGPVGIFFQLLGNCEILCVENGYCLGIAKTLTTKW